MSRALLQKCVAEFVGTFALIFIGVCTIYNNSPNSGVGLLGVALAHGLTIAVMVSATGAISGGHLNPAVTFGLWTGGHVTTRDLVAYWAAQLLGATAAGFALVFILRHDPAAPGIEIVMRGTPALSSTVS